MSCPLYRNVSEIVVCVEVQTKQVTIEGVLSYRLDLVETVRRVLRCKCGELLQIRPPWREVPLDDWTKLNNDLRELGRLHVRDIAEAGR